MTAALLVEPRRIEIREVEIPVPGPHEVLVQLKSCGVCATDVKKYTGDSKAPHMPFILGHEPAGIIRETGAAVNPLYKADLRVAVAPVVTCGTCYACRTGLTLSQGMGMCDHYEVLGFSSDGAFAEYIVAPASNVYPIPDQLSFRDAALIEPVSACANGVLRASNRNPGTAAVFGAGFMGLVMVQLLRLLGHRVIALELVEERRRLAEKLGADVVLNPGGTDAIKDIRELTEGRGADQVICAVGGKAITEQGLSMLAKGGTLVLMASAQHGTKFEVDLSKTHYDECSITGSVSYTGYSWQWATELLRDHKLDVDTLITSAGPLECVSEYLQMTKDAVGIKKVVLY